MQILTRFFKLFLLILINTVECVLEKIIWEVFKTYIVKYFTWGENEQLFVAAPAPVYSKNKVK